MSLLPKVFVGSSTEALTVARQVKARLEDVASVTVWDDLFEIGVNYLQSLAKQIATFDFAVMILAPDDSVQVRGEHSFTPRDNVLIELGICVGSLGPSRSYALFQTQPPVTRIPSDMSGVQWGYYDPASGAKEKAIMQIRTQIAVKGRRSPSELTVYVTSASSGNCLDVRNWATEEGSEVHLWAYHGGANQCWALQREYRAHFRIVSMHSHMFLEAALKSAGEAVQVRQGVLANTDRQIWHIIKMNEDGTYQVRPKGDNVCLTTADDGRGLLLREWNGRPEQRWVLKHSLSD